MERLNKVLAKFEKKTPISQIITTETGHRPNSYRLKY